MKENKEILKRKERGITLIALVITIIVLLILAGVSIAMLTGENGILTQAQNAKNKTEQSGEEEKVKLAVVAAKTDGYGEIKEEDLTNELIKYFENKSNFNIEPSKNENSYLITITESERSYYVEENGNVTSNLYIIRDLDNLESFRDEVNKGNTFEGTTVVLLSDIELQGNWEPIGQIEEGVDENWAGTGTNYFKGDFYGMGHTISNMTLNYEELNSGYNNLGFFSKNYGKIYDLNVECDIDAKVVGNGNILFLGAISGFSFGDIQNCKASGTIDISPNNDGSVRIGGLVGQCNDGDFSNCYNEITIKINQANGVACGGIVGYYEINKSLEKCANVGNIYVSNTKDGHGQVGGITGYVTGVSSNAYMKNLYNTGEITIENSNSVGVGGILSYTDVSNIYIRNIYNKGSINTDSPSNIGGIIGLFTKGGKISNAYNVGRIDLELTDSAFIGGICGVNSGIIDNVYNSGQINNINQSHQTLGAITGDNQDKGIIENAYYTNSNIEVSGSNRGTIDNDTAGRKENLPTILEVINSDNAFKEGEDGNPIFNE